MTTDRTASRPTWLWGTNPSGGVYYAGRVHVVAPEGTATGLCGLPVPNVWKHRPRAPEHLCPDCCVLAMAASHPPLPAPPSYYPPAGWREVAENDWFAAERRDQAAQAATTGDP